MDRQSELPRSISLFRYVPDRVQFAWREWSPAIVRSAADLPQYLILGSLDPSTFEQSAGGWSARWQGTEIDTHFDVAYRADSGRWEIGQTWCGLNGGFGLFPVKVSLEKVISEGLYSRFPGNWDAESKSQLETKYQMTVVEQPKDFYSIFGIPDGAFRTIIFPVAVHNLGAVRDWIRVLVERSPLAYPVTVDARLVFQAINYVDGKAPEWTTQPAAVFNHSVIETGLLPQAFPVREEAKDGSAAWTLRREIYFLSIGVPFAGLTDFLERIAIANGPVRRTSDPEFRFELRPVVIPAGYEIQIESLATLDDKRATRSFLTFPRLGGMPASVEEVLSAEMNSSETLAKAENISQALVAEVERIFNSVKQGGAT